MSVTINIGTNAVGGATDFTSTTMRKGQAFLETGTVDLFFAGAIVGVVSVGLYGIANCISFFRKEKTGKEATFDTFKDSGKTGLASVVGIVTGNTVAATGLVLFAPGVLPIAAAVTTTFFAKNMWDKATASKKNQKPHFATRSVMGAQATA
ncbi:MAG: hypothetical protein HQL29_01310 [Candidatus Omnitrophica bacterium]|nr:hypothetical protein [Candidatus Omnitrophota bacterium]